MGVFGEEKNEPVLVYNYSPRVTGGTTPALPLLSGESKPRVIYFMCSFWLLFGRTGLMVLTATMKVWAGAHLR